MIRGYSLIILAVALGVCIAEDPSLKNHWSTFKKTFKKSFKNSNHESSKREHWEKNVKGILEHNLQADMGLHTYKKAVNEYTDFTQQEIETKLCGLRLPNKTREFRPVPVKLTNSRAPAPANFDWRSRNAVTSVKNQQTCGSCWTFAVAGAMEGLYAISTGKAPVDLSEQQLLDCSSGYGTTGCNGGWPDDAYRYVKDKGISTYTCYPYENAVGQCRYKESCKVATLVNFYDVPKDETTLRDYLFTYGPISVCVYVSDSFGSYSGGVYSSDSCDQAVNHAVLLVGYGTENGVDYWTIKNSWGPGWGEKGYIRIARNKNNMCRITQYAAFPYSA